MQVAIIGGGIVGLTLGLNLHARGIGCRIYEAAPDIQEIGVGITLLPHGVRELAALGLQDRLLAAGIENRESAFFNRFGQLIYKEPRGRQAGYATPEIGIHRGRLHAILYAEAKARLGADNIVTGRRAQGVEQDDDGVTIRFEGGQTARADIAIACDGVNSAVRRQFYPDETVVFTGINTWRGVTRRKPILDGRTYMRIGSLKTGKIVVYPIGDALDGSGDQLINWVAEIQSDNQVMNDWNAQGRLDQFYPLYESWKFDWLDVSALIRDAERVFEYPMVDKDPIDRWTFGRVTFAGDAAHPMYPRGSNGSAQGVIDARVLAEHLTRPTGPVAGLAAYEAARLGPTAAVVRANRATPPANININVEALTGDRPFEDLDAIISQDELRALSDRYKQVAGFAIKPQGAST